MLVDLVKSDAEALGLNFEEYKEGMTGGYIVYLVVRPESVEQRPRDYHWYRLDSNGYWYHKMASYWAEPVEDYRENANDMEYTVPVGYFYITRRQQNEERCN